MKQKRGRAKGISSGLSAVCQWWSGVPRYLSSQNYPEMSVW